MLLAIFAFNCFGFRIWFNWVQANADEHLEKRLNNGDYREADLVAIKIPMALPYLFSRSQAERVDGEFSQNGQTYKYVKYQMQGDTIVLYCIPHDDRLALEKRANAYFAKVNDLSNNSKGKKTLPPKIVTDDYSTIEKVDKQFMAEPKSYALFIDAHPRTAYLPLYKPPPRHIFTA